MAIIGVGGLERYSRYERKKKKQVASVDIGVHYVSHNPVVSISSLKA